MLLGLAAGGSAAHGWARRLADPRGNARDLADAVHALCAVHGRQPGLIERAQPSSGDLAGANLWLASAAAAFSGERAALARLTAAAGPLPSTPGQAESEAALTAQRHALDMLGQSARAGCALGAAIGLVLDWAAIQPVLVAAAERFGMAQVPPMPLPTELETAALVTALVAHPATERALRFGTEQVIVQHRALWDLLEARAAARG